MQAQQFECLFESDEVLENQEANQPHSQQSCYNLNSCATKKVKHSDNLANAPIVKVRLNFHFIKTGNYGLNQKLDGKTTQWIKGKVLELDYTTKAPGLYILSIRDANDVIYYSKIIKL